MANKLLILLVSLFSVSAFSADLISEHEVKKFKLEKIGDISVSETGGTISSPSDLHNKLSELADKKGGKYYVITAAREHGNNFEAVARVYK